MLKYEHDVSKGEVVIREMTPEEVTTLQAQREAYQVAKEAEAAKPTPQKELLAAVQAAKTVEELRAVVEGLVTMLFNLPAEAREVSVEDEGQIR